jgi:hypothetical protein
MRVCSHMRLPWAESIGSRHHREFTGPVVAPHRLCAHGPGTSMGWSEVNLSYCLVCVPRYDEGARDG